jgi:hypothetical protein
MVCFASESVLCEAVRHTVRYYLVGIGVILFTGSDGYGGGYGGVQNVGEMGFFNSAFYFGQFCEVSEEKEERLW